MAMISIIESNYNPAVAAAYADIICVNHVNDVKFLTRQLVDCANVKYARHDINDPIVIGNYAYLSINAPAPYCLYARNMYDIIIKMLRDSGETFNDRLKAYNDDIKLKNGNIDLRGEKQNTKDGDYLFIVIAMVIVLFVVAIIDTLRQIE